MIDKSLFAVYRTDATQARASVYLRNLSATCACESHRSRWVVGAKLDKVREHGSKWG